MLFVVRTSRLIVWDFCIKKILSIKKYFFRVIDSNFFFVLVLINIREQLFRKCVVKVSKMNAQTAQNLRNSKSKVAFGNSPMAVIEEAGRRVKALDVAREQMSKLNPLQRFITKLGIDNNEMTNNLITAVGTAGVAPIFIAFNPFTRKESKETKVYSAARQPISAVITLAFQYAVVNVFNDVLDNLATKGKLKGIGINFDAEPRESVLTRQIKKEMPGINREELIRQVKHRQDLAEKGMIKQLLDEGFNPADEDLIGGKAFNKALKELKQGAQAKAPNLEQLAKNLAIENVKKEIGDLAPDALKKARIEQYVKALVENSNISYKFFRNFSGAAISLAILPFSCGLLNWAYPRIMEKLMPEVAAAKKATKEKEVK